MAIKCEICCTLTFAVPENAEQLESLREYEREIEDLARERGLEVI